ncbi:MAG: ACP S-malonyltransferase [Gloeobacterales cyanobacterium]
MTKTAWVFPGQGSQKQGMAGDMASHPLTRSLFEEADALLGWSVAERCVGPQEELDKTLYTQPCLYVVSAAATLHYRALGEVPDVVCGHSLGEYTALWSAGVFDFATGLNLVQKRAWLMDQQTQQAPGSMAAVLGFERTELDRLIQEIDGVVVANDNSSGQVVISGTKEAVSAIQSQLKAKRFIPLAVSGAFHSPLMTPAAQAFREILEAIPFQTAQVPVLSNTEPMATEDPTVLKERLARQIDGPVRWRETVIQLAQLSVERTVEIGPGSVLTGLIKKTDIPDRPGPVFKTENFFPVAG